MSSTFAARTTHRNRPGPDRPRSSPAPATHEPAKARCSGVELAYPCSGIIYRRGQSARYIVTGKVGGENCSSIRAPNASRSLVLLHLHPVFRAWPASHRSMSNAALRGNLGRHELRRRRRSGANDRGCVSPTDRPVPRFWPQRDVGQTRPSASPRPPTLELGHRARSASTRHPRAHPRTSSPSDPARTAAVPEPCLNRSVRNALYTEMYRSRFDSARSNTFVSAPGNTSIRSTEARPACRNCGTGRPSGPITPLTALIPHVHDLPRRVPHHRVIPDHHPRCRYAENCIASNVLKPDRGDRILQRLQVVDRRARTLSASTGDRMHERNIAETMVGFPRTGLRHARPAQPMTRGVGVQQRDRLLHCHITADGTHSAEAGRAVSVPSSTANAGVNGSSGEDADTPGAPTPPTPSHQRRPSTPTTRPVRASSSTYTIR